MCAAAVQPVAPAPTSTTTDADGLAVIDVEFPPEDNAANDYSFEDLRAVVVARPGDGAVIGSRIGVNRADDTGIASGTITADRVVAAVGA